MLQLQRTELSVLSANNQSNLYATGIFLLGHILDGDLFQKSGSDRAGIRSVLGVDCGLDGVLLFSFEQNVNFPKADDRQE
ncbi:MAG: hypothetical protein JWP44_4475 [Mucilaginibacter sp.]|jgi:hypothetical protein|nr:hypothetical protein [Mucilaginibacter sp.]